MHILSLVVLTLAGCGYNEESFAEALEESYCDYAARCFDQTDCSFSLETTCEDGTEFSKDRAEACIEELDTLECEGDNPSIPRYCADPCE